MKFLEWLGFIICVCSILANGYFRSIDNQILLEQLTFFSAFGGAIISVASFFIRKFRVRKKRKEHSN